MADEQSRVRSVFLAAIEHVPAEWPGYLDEACADQPAVRAEVERLLRAQAQLGSFHEGGNPRLTATIDDPITERPGTVVGPYRLMEQVGEGGMGLVFVAEQAQPVRRRVALKVIKPGMDSRQVVARFEAERQALALMDHPNIAKVLDGGETATGRPYFVMELVKGLPITEHCDQNRLTVRQRLGLFADVCQAVQHAHQKGVIHRDLKPSNVLVAVHDVTPVVKVIDFGVAKATGQQLTDKTVYTGLAHMVGTPLYMSPEQAGQSCLDVDTRSDVYSLGVLLYELLTGTTPFDRARMWEATYDEVRRIIREEEPPRPSTRISTLGKAVTTTAAEARGTDVRNLAVALRGELDWVVMKALEKDRNRRYESAGALAADVQRYLDDLPVEASPPSTVYRLRKFARRNRAALLTGGLVVAALVGGTAVSVWQAARATEQRGLAERREAEAEAAAEAARESDQATKAVLKFIGEHVLGAASPNMGGLGRDLTLRHALDAAEPRIAAAFGTRPRVEAQLRNQLAEAYYHLNEPRLALPQIERAYALGRAHFGADDEFTLEAEFGVCLTYGRLGRQKDVAALLEPALARRRQSLGADHKGTYQTIHLLAETYDMMGRKAEAMALWKELQAHLDRWEARDFEGITPLEYWRLLKSVGMQPHKVKSVRFLEEGLPGLVREKGPSDDDVLGYTWWLLLGYLNQGRYAEGAALAEKTYPHVVARYKYHGAMFTNYLSGLPQFLSKIGRTADAVKIMEEALREMRRIYGPAHPTLFPFVFELAGYYTELGRPRDAATLLEATVAAVPKGDRDGHPCYAPLLQHLIDAQLRAGEKGRVEQAVAERAGWLRRRVQGEPALAYELFMMGLSIVKQGGYAAAEPLLRESLVLRRRQRPTHDKWLAGTLALLGRSLLGTGRPVEAEPVLRESLAIRERVSPDELPRFDSMSMLGGALLAQKRYAEAEPLVLAGYAGMAKRADTILGYSQPTRDVMWERMTDAADRPIELYTALGKPDKVAEWRATRAKYREAPRPVATPNK